MYHSSSLARPIALGFLASLLIAGGARSSTIVYGTTGVVLPFGGQSGPSVVTFNGVPSGAQFTDSNTFTIGDFKVTPAADGTTSSYANTPFLIQISGTRSDLAYPSIPIYSSIYVYGRLNGSVSNQDRSTLVATIDSVQPGPVPPTGANVSFVQILPFPPSALKIDSTILLASDGSGTTTVTAHVENTPEPGALAIFGTMAALGVLRHHRRPASR